ncbi:hypothetical protein A2Z22_00025 [Candidatus Woesebacteria bacterium RBG_16_34_12]|uniref:Uncharacterized protein n=1 Tax=Candidatus Woesebacteria bacterium RBG_16_34_12 TaxID=1802480 RepID=A0A1F7X6S8_9BACT|nr:MAG: hypothetical protein A2Z22_00025 [Candidatus Woesebacteria bacterium RBG_16_34_12]
MGKLIERILGLLSPLIIFSSNVEGKTIPDVRNINNIDSLDKIELISKPPPLVLQQVNLSVDDMLAGHRSHSSHASHRSHASHASGSYSPKEETTPSSSEQTTPKSSITPSNQSSPQKTSPSSKSSEDAIKKWQSTTEWKGNACKLYQRDVLVTLKGNRVLEGYVNECKNDAIEVIIPLANEKASHWVKLKDIESLLWK